MERLIGLKKAIVDKHRGSADDSRVNDELEVLNAEELEDVAEAPKAAADLFLATYGVARIRHDKPRCDKEGKKRRRDDEDTAATPASRSKGKKKNRVRTIIYKGKGSTCCKGS